MQGLCNQFNNRAGGDMSQNLSDSSENQSLAVDKKERTRLDPKEIAGYVEEVRAEESRPWTPDGLDGPDGNDVD